MYTDDLIISVESIEERLLKMQTWKPKTEKNGLCVNMGKAMILVSGINLDLLKKSGKEPFGV